MSLCLKQQQFVHTIGTAQYLILRLKHNILTDVSNPHLINDIDASLQNNILKCVFAVCNILKSMCQKISMPIPQQVHNYIYNSPIPISDRPLLNKNLLALQLICCISCETVSFCMTINCQEKHRLTLIQARSISTCISSRKS